MRFIHTLLLCLASTVFANSQVYASEPTNIKDRSISEISFEGLDQEQEQRVHNLIQSSVGLPFDLDDVEEDLRVLNSLGEFERIRAESTLQPNGDIHLLFTFTEQQIIAQISVVGNKLLSDQELLALVPLLPGLGKDADAIERGRRAIVDIYKKQGNYLVEVFAETILYPKGGVDERIGLQIDESVALIYRVMEGLRVRVKGVSVIGNHAFTDKELIGVLETNTSGEFFRRGELNEAVLETDAQRIRRFYMYRGYTDVRVSFNIMLSQNAKEAKVTFLIEEGPQYILGGISLRFTKAGNTQPVFTAEQIAALIPMKAGDVYRPIDVGEAVKTIQRAYGVLGHRKVDVDPLSIIMKRATKVFYGGDNLIQQEIVRVVPYRATSNLQIDIIFVIDEGIPMKVGFVTIKGNTVTKDRVIRGRLGLKPGHPFNEFELDRSIERLKRSGLFSNVTPRLYEDPHNPGYTNVEVAIKERQTGTMKVGDISIKGNMVTEDHQIRVRLGFYPGYPFDVQEAERSRERLLRTQLFSKVTMTIQPEDPDNPGYRNVEVDVVERQTGTLSFGLMAGSDSGLMGNISITQSNFDIADFPETWSEFLGRKAFIGAGQQFSMQFQLGDESGITLHFSIQGESSPNRTTDEILDAINTRSVARPANSPPLRLEQAWLTVCQIRTELLGEEINRDELRKQIDAMIGWIMSADDPANLGRRFAAGKPLKRGFDIERLALLGVAIAFAEAVDDVALAKKSLDFSFVIMNNSYSNLLPPLIAGWLNPVHPIKDSTVCDEVFSDLQSWLVNDSDHFQPEHLPWLDFAHAYVLSSRGLTNEALAVLPSLKSNVPDEPLFLLLQQTSLWKNHRSNPYTSQLSQRWVFETIHALSIYLLATEVEEKEQSIELLGLQFDGFPKELSDDLLSRLMKYKLPPITSFGNLDSDEKMQLIVYSVLLQEIKARVIEDNISDARSFLDLVLNEDFQSNTKTLLKSASLEETQ